VNVRHDAKRIKAARRRDGVGVAQTSSIWSASTTSRSQTAREIAPSAEFALRPRWHRRTRLVSDRGQSRPSVLRRAARRFCSATRSSRKSGERWDALARPDSAVFVSGLRLPGVRHSFVADVHRSPASSGKPSPLA
jgi:hypothetical protein